MNIEALAHFSRLDFICWNSWNYEWG